MTDTAITRKPREDTATRERLEDMYQVVLFNDDHNPMEYVIDCLQRVFGHPEDLAIKIMIEAHTRGKAIAGVESETPARQHCRQLVEMGLNAEVAPI